MPLSKLFYGINLSARQFRAVELTSQGYTVSHVASVMASEFPDINTRKVRRDLEYLYTKLGLVESESTKKLYNQNVVLSALFFEWQRGSAQIEQTSIKREAYAKLNDDGCVPWEHYYTWSGSGFITSIANEFTLSPEGPESFIETPPVIEIIDFEGGENFAPPTVEFEILEPKFTRWHYVFRTELAQPRTFDLSVKSLTPMKKSLTKKQNFDFWRKVHPIGSASAPYLPHFQGRVYSFTELEANEKGIFSFSFPMAYPVEDLQLGIYDINWTAMTELQEYIERNNAFQINNRPMNVYGGEPIYSAMVKLSENQRINVAFHWLPLVEESVK